MYNVILWKDNGNEDIHVFEKKPTFKELYPLIGCSTIQIVAGYTDEHKHLICMLMRKVNLIL